MIRNEKIAQENFDYIKQVENSGPEGERWVQLWRENAPKNQSLKQFQESFGNNLDEAENLVGGLNATTINKEYSNAFDAYHSKYDVASYEQYAKYRDQAEKEYLDKIAEARSTGADVKDIKYKGITKTSKPKGFESWSDEQIELAGNLYDAETMRNLERQEGALYSTFNPEVSKIQQETKQKLAAMDEEWTDLTKKYKEEKGNYDGFYEDPETRAWYSKQAELTEEYQYRIGQVAVENKTIVSQELANNFDDILKQNTRLSERMNSWDTLSTDEKLTLLQEAIDEYARKYKTPFTKIEGKNIQVRSDGFHAYGYSNDTTKTITFNTNSATGGILQKSPDEAISALLHEYGHQIDYRMASKGSVGPQIMKGMEGTDLYTSQGPTYVLAPTEQSSYSHSGAVLSDGNWPLKQAKRRANRRVDTQNLQNFQKIEGDDTVPPWEIPYFPPAE